jgi:hypothetical protein
MDGIWQYIGCGGLTRQPAFLQPAYQLLGKEGIAPGALGYLLAHRCRQFGSQARN